MAAVFVDEWPDLEAELVVWLEDVAVLVAEVLLLMLALLFLKMVSRLEEAHFEG